MNNLAKLSTRILVIIISLFLVLTGCSNQQTKKTENIKSYQEIQTKLTDIDTDPLVIVDKIREEKEASKTNGQIFWFDENNTLTSEGMQYLDYSNKEVRAIKNHIPSKFQIGACDKDDRCKIISPTISKEILTKAKNSYAPEFYASTDGDIYSITGKDIDGIFTIYQNNKELFSKKMYFGAESAIVDKKIIDGNPTFTFYKSQNTTNTFYKGETMNEKYKVNASENLFAANGKIGFVATKNGKKFIEYDGQKVSQDFDTIRTTACCAQSSYPFDIDKNGILSFLAKRGNKYYITEINLKNPQILK